MQQDILIMLYQIGDPAMCEGESVHYYYGGSLNGIQTVVNIG